MLQSVFRCVCGVRAKTLYKVLIAVRWMKCHGKYCLGAMRFNPCVSETKRSVSLAGPRWAIENDIVAFSKLERLA